jgi:hypothetical protein
MSGGGAGVARASNGGHGGPPHFTLPGFKLENRRL